jgi:hypothetical protein
MKICRKKLHQYQDDKSFCPECRINSKDKWRKSNLSKDKATAKKWKKANTDKLAAQVGRNRERNPNRTKGKTLLQYWPNLSWQECLINYDNLFLRQKGLCAICKQPETFVDKRTGKVIDLAVDHCHETGKVRGLLCRQHNFGLGFFKDNPNLLNVAANYLTENG